MASSPQPEPVRHRLSYEARIAWRAFLCAVPGLAVSLVLLLVYGAGWKVWITALAFLLTPLPFIIWNLQAWITHPLRVAANTMGSIREGDFTVRSKRVEETSGAIVDLYREINDIAVAMDKTRISGIETRSAIDKIMAHIDVATLIVDGNRCVSQANDAALRLVASLNEWEVPAIGRSVDELKLAFCLDASHSDFSRFSFVDKGRRFEGRRGIFRMENQRFDLILLTDITRAAREQERESWQRLLRVLGHELNNSIAPIHSLSNTLARITRATEMDTETKSDLLDSLEAISSRSESVIRFMQDYSRIARLPQPAPERFELGPVAAKACQLFGNAIALRGASQPCFLYADRAQLEQALINLLKNAVEASADLGGSVTLSWLERDGHASISIVDQGPGISNPDNLFVPFYSTKERGSGIGLAISKQIVEAVDGSLTLENRRGARGCVATITLPVAPSEP